MKLERKVRLCSAAAAVLIAAIALTGCGGSKPTASSAAASSVAASTAAATNNSCGEGVTWALADGTLTISGTGSDGKEEELLSTGFTVGAKDSNTPSGLDKEAYTVTFMNGNTQVTTKT